MSRRKYSNPEDEKKAIEDAKPKEPSTLSELKKFFEENLRKEIEGVKEQMTEQIEKINKTIEDLTESVQKENDAKCYIESDTYVLMSFVVLEIVPMFCIYMTLFFSLIFFMLIFIVACFTFCQWGKVVRMTKDTFSFIKGVASGCLVLVPILMIFVMLIIPGCFVIVTQIYCVWTVNQLIEMSPSDQIDNLDIKWCLNIFFLFLVGNEAVQGLKCLVFMIMKMKIVNSRNYCPELLFKLPGCVISLFPCLAQIATAFVIYYFSLCMIYVDQDMISFIQNFAGLYVILEFDNIVIKFLQVIDFYSMFTWYLRKMTDGKSIGDGDFDKYDAFDMFNSGKSVTEFFWLILKFRPQLKQILSEDKVGFLKMEEEEHLSYENCIVLGKLLAFAACLLTTFLLFFNYS